MGTNYYLKRNICRHCNRGDDDLHIGKSSSGWCFSLHVIPEEGIDSLDDWSKIWGDGEIFNEYGEKLTGLEMFFVITNRSSSGPTTKEFCLLNGADPGPNNLARRKIDKRCIGHGKGTWDLIIGEFG